MAIEKFDITDRLRKDIITSRKDKSISSYELSELRRYEQKNLSKRLGELIFDREQILNYDKNKSTVSMYVPEKVYKEKGKDNYAKIILKVDGKYFLVQNARTKKYQPVGGAYKLEPKEAQYLSEKIPVEDDDRIPIDTTTIGDYRLYVKNKDLRKFIKRFDKTPYRENINNLSREFKEELFTTNILDRDTFGDLTYKYCGRHITDVEYGNFFECYELLLADIIEVRLTNKQEELFRELMKKTDDQYIFATFNEIKTGGVKHGTSDLKDNIANHAPKILSENSDILINKSKYKNDIMIKFD